MREEIRLLAEEPRNYLSLPYQIGYALSREEREHLALAGMAKRFDTLRPGLKALDRLAGEQGIAAIRAIDEVAPLLFPHTVYKSYPLSFLERGQFDRLTKWLRGLTTVDVSGVETDGLASIDDWIARLETQSELQLIHTFGTSGKLSFFPRTRAQGRAVTTLSAHCFRDWPQPGAGPDMLAQSMPLIYPSYRYGASASNRGVDNMITSYAGGEHNTLFLYPDAYFSADIASLAGRLRAAEARGEAGQVALSPALVARRDEFAARERDRPESMNRFFAEAERRFGGKDVFLLSVWHVLYEWAEEGLKRGIKNVFGKGSLLSTGGGAKGRPLPPDYKEQIFEFLGFDNHIEFYGMSELMANMPRCEAGNFHIPPVLVPFVLDPATGVPLPRAGQQIGRFAAFDLLPDSYWGGLVTGDEVTLAGWDEPCACGRPGPHVIPPILRFSEAQGGDDKINCAGAPEAHDRALDYLLREAG